MIMADKFRNVRLFLVKDIEMNRIRRTVNIILLVSTILILSGGLLKILKFHDGIVLMIVGTMIGIITLVYENFRLKRKIDSTD